MADVDIVMSKKERLQAIAGDSFPMYLEKMRQFSSGKLSKEELDVGVRELLPPDGVHVHNELFLLVSNSIFPALPSYNERDFYVERLESNKDVSMYSKKRKKLNYDSSYISSFHQAHISSYLPIPPENPSNSRCVDWLSLPDTFSIPGLMNVAAWRYGIYFVDSNAFHLMAQAIRNKLKTIIMLVLSRRNAYKLRENDFRYAYGTSPLNIYLQNANSQQQNSNLGENNCLLADQGSDVACGDSPAATGMEDAKPNKLQSVITAWDLYETLRVYRGVFPSQSVYFRAVESASAALYHPSVEEMEQQHQIEITKEKVAKAKTHKESIHTQKPVET